MSSSTIVAAALFAIVASSCSAAMILAFTSGGGGGATSAPPSGGQTGTSAPGGGKAGTLKPPDGQTGTTKPAAVYTKQECRDAVYRWVKAVQKSGASATGGWYDVSLGSEVRKICGGCFKKDEAGLMFGKAIGLKRYPDQWDSTKISRVADDSFHQWAASYFTENLPGTCSAS